MRGLPLQWLKAFEATARLLSFTAAAKELGLTQSAISQQIRLLESYLGEPLFYRRGRGIALTESANHFFPVVHDCFSRLETGISQFNRSHEPFTISVSSNISFWLYWLLPRTSEFLDKHPAGKLRFSTTRWSTDPKRTGASIEIMYGDGDWSLPSERLTDTILFPVCSPDIAAKIETPRDILKFDRILAYGEEALWEEWGDAAGLDMSTMPQRFTVDLQLAAIDLACRGRGIALANGVLAFDLLQSGSLCIPIPGYIRSRDNYYLSMRDVAGNGKDAVEFREWMKAALKAHQKTLIESYFDCGSTPEPAIEWNGYPTTSQAQDPLIG